MTVLAADWPAPAGVTAFTTLMTGGTSEGMYRSLNLGAHVGDVPERVAQNRRLVQTSQGWDTEPLWLDQVHGTTVVRWSGDNALPQADGAVTSLPGHPLVVMTADCLPVVACDRAGTVVGAFHAGWRGLLAGILEEGIRALGVPTSEVIVWIGPAIGPDHTQEFRPDGSDHWKFDLPGAAVRRLQALGVGSVTRSSWDTFRDRDLFFSHRRQGRCGRIGTFICLEKTPKRRVS